MSILTKLFVVLVSVLSILLVALVVPFVANTENYKALRDADAAKLASAMQTAQERQAEIVGLQTRAAETTEAHRAALAERDTQIAMLTQKLADAEMRAESQQTRLSKMEADLARLTAAEQQHAQFLAAQEAELKARREADVEQKTRLIQSADRINELAGQNEQLQQAVRRFREELQARTEERDTLASQIQRLPADVRASLSAESASGVFEAQTLLQAQVTEVQQFSGQTFAQINIGANDGVAQNMKFIIHRGDTYLGDLVITLVDDRAAAGVIRMAQGAVQVGDSVRSGGRF